MEDVKKYFEKNTTYEYKCKIKTKDENGVELDKACGSVVVVSKDSLWNLKRHLIRSHPDVIAKMDAAERGF
jgi:hypothetical protein